jgi:chorismate dehydratase
MPIRLGAVSFLNTLPLVYGLDRQPERFSIRFDVPSRCAELLTGNNVDLGLIPSIEYLQNADYRIVPGVSIASNGPVASVALFSRRQPSEIATIALDTSSRTSIALLKILCVCWFEIHPQFVPMPPNLPAMVKKCDAALVIGDNALFADHDALGLEKIDLGEEWVGMTGLPFVYAFWAGRSGVAGGEDVAALQDARDKGVAITSTIAQQSFPNNPGRAAIADRYLREHIKYALGGPEEAGLRRFYDLAAEIGIVPEKRELEFYGVH